MCLLLEAVEGEVGHVPVATPLEVHDVLGFARRYVGVVEHEPVVPLLPDPPHVVTFYFSKVSRRWKAREAGEGGGRKSVDTRQRARGTNKNDKAKAKVKYSVLR